MKPSAQQIETARQILTNAGFCVESLWHVDTITKNFNCTNEQAMEILNKVTDSNAVLNFIYDELMYVSEQEYNLKLKS